MKKLLPLLIAFAGIGCSMEKDLQAEVYDAELIKIDTVYRYPEYELFLTWRFQDKFDYVTRSRTNTSFSIGEKYFVLLPK
jgi:hypothetical protein